MTIFITIVEMYLKLFKTILRDERVSINVELEGKVYTFKSKTVSCCNETWTYEDLDTILDDELACLLITIKEDRYDGLNYQWERLEGGTWIPLGSVHTLTKFTKVRRNIHADKMLIQRECAIRPEIVRKSYGVWIVEKTPSWNDSGVYEFEKVPVIEAEFGEILFYKQYLWTRKIAFNFNNNKHIYLLIKGRLFRTKRGAQLWSQ